MEGPIEFVSALGLVALLELGDKTQLATISLAARYPWRPVLAGASLGLAAATAIGVVAAGALLVGFSPWLIGIKVAGGALFIALGLWGYLRPEHEHPEEERQAKSRGPFAQAFLVNLLAEMGDKTQIAVLVLAATTAAPVSVFVGACLGLVLVATSSVFIGATLSTRLSERALRVLSAGLFVAAGTILILEAAWPR